MHFREIPYGFSPITQKLGVTKQNVFHIRILNRKIQEINQQKVLLYMQLKLIIITGHLFPAAHKNVRQGRAKRSSHYHNIGLSEYHFIEEKVHISAIQFQKFNKWRSVKVEVVGVGLK